MRDRSPEFAEWEGTALGEGARLDELIATVAILRAKALSADRLSAAMDYVGSAAYLVNLALSETASMASPVVLRDLTIDHVAWARTEVGRWLARGLDPRTPLDPSYPANLQMVHNKPPLLFVEGRWDESFDSRSVAVVGTRAASEDGLLRARRLARELAAAKVTVVSGLARGIDGAAHNGALEGGGRTVAVMGTGIALRYPTAHARLAAAIVDAGGALLSQFSPDQGPTRWTFPLRNVTMSGLSLATIVVEAGPTSGARMQAEAALKHGRAVFLPRPLVEGHEWARDLTERGIAGVTAVMIDSTENIVERLVVPAPPAAASVA